LYLHFKSPIVDLVGQIQHDLPARFDPTDPAVHEDPYPTYARLREAGALSRGGPGQWVVTRYDDVAAILSDARLGNEFPQEYHSFSVGDGPARDFFQRIVLHQDKPHHTRLRKLMGRGFGPPVVRELRAYIGGLVDAVLARAAEQGRLQAVDDLAFPLPVIVVCQLTGIPPQERDEVRPRVFALGRAFAAKVGPADRVAADDAVVWLRDYIGGLLDLRRTRPEDDLLSRMLAAEEDGDRLGHDEIVDNIIFLFFAGFETAASMIATGCAALLEHPGQLAKLRADPALAAAAVEEFLRYDAPIQSRLRLVLEPIDVGGRLIRPGRVVLALIGSANRDPRHFDDPDRLDITRRPNSHLSFGGGIHYCLGAALARMEGDAVFSRLPAAFRAIELEGPPVRAVDSAFRTYSSVPISVRAS
jgi:cytochrome P450